MVRSYSRNFRLAERKRQSQSRFVVCSITISLTHSLSRLIMTKSQFNFRNNTSPIHSQKCVIEKEKKNRIVHLQLIANLTCCVCFFYCVFIFWFAHLVDANDLIKKKRIFGITQHRGIFSARS